MSPAAVGRTTDAGAASEQSERADAARVRARARQRRPDQVNRVRVPRTVANSTPGARSLVATAAVVDAVAQPNAVRATSRERAKDRCRLGERVRRFEDEA